MVPIGELSEYAKSGLPTAAKGIGKSLDLKPNTVHYIVKDVKKKAEDNNRKLLDQRSFEDASRSDRSCIRATALSLSQRLIHSENRVSRP